MFTADTTNYPDWLKRRAFTNPERMALIASGQQLTFAELDACVDRTARWLLSVGVTIGDHVALHLPNSLAFVELVHAIARVGAVLVPINLRLTNREIAWQLGDVRASTLITGEPADEFRGTIREQSPATQVIVIDPHDPDFTSGVDESEAELIYEHTPDALSAIVYTSGTTGRPKGSLLSYGNHWWSAIGSGLNLGIHADDRWMAVLPLFHVGGLSILMRSVIYGITVVVHESFDPDAVNRSIDQDRVTIISVVSTMLRRMLAARQNDAYPEWLRCVLLGGGPAPRPLLEECARRNVPVTQTYGLTESASQIATLPPEDALRKLGSAGKPLYPNEIAIESDRQYAGPHEAGEILVRGPIITAGYYAQTAATEEAFRDGWFHTGDAGYLDEDGNLYVLDRRDDLIVTGGENVYPAEVEAVLSGFDGIDEAGVVGVPDAEWGHRVVCVVSCTSGVSPSPDVVQSWCREHLAGYKIPTTFRFTAEPLPRNAGGKLLRRTLREWFDPCAS
jgi:o-succinylbenzoate---CoA ligase